MSNVSINYPVVASQVSTMETLSATATTLQNNLDGLKASLTANWNGGGAEALLNNFDEFVANIDVITADINSVREWCENTVAMFKSTTNSNAQAITDAMSGR